MFSSRKPDIRDREKISASRFLPPYRRAMMESAEMKTIPYHSPRRVSSIIVSVKAGFFMSFMKSLTVISSCDTTESCKTDRDSAMNKERENTNISVILLISSIGPINLFIC